MSVKIKNVISQFECEPLIRPFGFKGGYMNQIWQVAVWMESEEGTEAVGLGTQNVLWSDKKVFTSTSESAGNSLMFAVTDYALQLIKGQSFENPISLQDQIFDEVYGYSKKITNQPRLSKTFVFNALVPVDNAAWTLYAHHKGFANFDKIIPADYQPALSFRHKQVASIPIASYGMPLKEVVKLVEEEGYQILKFKLGSPGSQKEMLEQDKARIEELHNVIGDKKVDITDDGKLPYYFDLNGRYEDKDSLKTLLDHVDKIGALDQLKVLEEPFPEEYKADVGDLGVMVAADESAHTPGNVKERIGMGYGAIALKPAAKTLSSTLKMAKVAHEHFIPCFCADLTVNPILVDWNKTVAARLQPVPGFKTGLLETNGHQNYKRWDEMKTKHPVQDASWIDSKKGVFQLNESFYRESGGIFRESSYYRSIF